MNSRIAVGSLALLGASACKGAKDDDVVTASVPAVQPVEPAAAAGTPFPAGSLVQEPVTITFAVYANPTSTADVEVVAREIHQERFAYLRSSTSSTSADEAPAIVFAAPLITTFAPPDVEALGYFGRGLDEAQKQAVQRSPKVVVMAFVAGASDAVKVHADALAMASAIAERTGGFIWDEDTRELFTAAAWKERRSASVDDPKHLQRHFTLHSYREGELMRIVSLGLAKFGLPDLVVENVPAASAEMMAIVVNNVAVTMASAPKLEQPGVLLLDVAAVGGPKPDGAPDRITVNLAVATADEGDPDNRLAEIVFPGPAESLHQRQLALIGALVEMTDDVVVEEDHHDPAMLAASAAAKKELVALESEFRAGALEQDVLLVKAPFPKPEGGNEWMWVEVTSWNDNEVVGILQNDPIDVPGLEIGAKVEVDENSLFDYILQRADGTVEGNKTAKQLDRKP